MKATTRFVGSFLVVSLGFAHAASAAQQVQQTAKEQAALRTQHEQPTRAYLAGPGPAPPAHLLPTGPPTVGPYTSYQVNVDACLQNITGDAANEPSIAVDPTAPNRLVIGWRQFDNVLSDFRQAGWGFSKDGGRTWTFPGVIDPGLFRSDPVLGSDSSGVFYYMSLESSMAPVPFALTLFRSTDGGETWGPGTPAGGGDKEWFVVDNTGNASDGYIHQTWQIASTFTPNQYTRSTDGGASFETPSELTMSRPIFGKLDLASDSTLYVCGRGFPDDMFHVLRSDDAKNGAVVPPTFPQDVIVDLGGPQVFAPAVNPVGLAGQVDVATAPAGNDLYLLCSIDPAGSDPLDVGFSSSTDGGVTWSAPVRVNDDAMGNDAYQWFATMDVAPNGRIDVVWNDTRNDATPANPSTSELFYTYSNDGGATWAANVAISPPYQHGIGYPVQEKLGDYYQVISDELGAHVAYAATFNGEQDVWYVRVGDYDCNGNGVSDTVDIMMGEPDCNMNGIPDSCEIASGQALDLNMNTIPDECEGPVASPEDLDVKPGSCPNSFNLKSRGKLPVALVGSNTLDVSMVDLSTVRLSRVDGLAASAMPIEGPPGPHSRIDDVTEPFGVDPCDCGPVDPDGIDDLVMHFDSDDVVESLGLECFAAGAMVELILTGELMGGGAFAAVDCIRVVPGSTKPPILVSSNVANVWMDVTPVDEYADAGGFTPFARGHEEGHTVYVTAPERQGRQVFQGWLVDDSAIPVESLTVAVPADGLHHRVHAVYAPSPPVAGSSTDGTASTQVEVR